MVRVISTKVGFVHIRTKPCNLGGFSVQACMVTWDRYFCACGTSIGALHVIVGPAVSGRARTAIRHVKLD